MEFTNIRHVTVTGSTNADLRAAAREGLAEGAVLVADHQTAGRGRRDRSWRSSPGDALLASVLLRPRVAPDRLGLVPLAVGVAIVDAARDLSASGVALKWPNDVVAGEGKLAGILSELVDGAVIVGFGVNLAATPPEIPGAVSLRDLIGTVPDRDVVLETVLGRLGELYGRLDDATIVDEATRRMTTIGRPVRIERTGGSLTGRALALDDGGRLVVEVDEGPERVVVAAGDVVHLRAL